MTRLPLVLTLLAGCATAPVAKPVSEPAAAAEPTAPPAAAELDPVADAPFSGPSGARVTIIEAFEFACPYSNRVEGTLAQLMADYPGQIKLVRMSLVVHPQLATEPALAACAAHQQGKYHEYIAELWSKGFPDVRDGGYADERLVAYAQDAGLDVARFDADRHGEACQRYIEGQQGWLVGQGINATPSFIINGTKYSGAQPIEFFKGIVDAELAKPPIPAAH